jgi:GDPmannose 4,6-dehydratase
MEMSPANKVALNTGVTGQGAYIAVLQLRNGYMVHGINCRSSLFNTYRIDRLYQKAHVDNAKFKLHYVDLTDSTNLIRIIQQVQSDRMRYITSWRYIFEIPECTAKADGIDTLRILEAIRILGFEKNTKRKVMDLTSINKLYWKRTMLLRDGFKLSYQVG